MPVCSLYRGTKINAKLYDLCRSVLYSPTVIPHSSFSSVFHVSQIHGNHMTLYLFCIGSWLSSYRILQHYAEWWQLPGIFVCHPQSLLVSDVYRWSAYLGFVFECWYVLGGLVSGYIFTSRNTVIYYVMWMILLYDYLTKIHLVFSPILSPTGKQTLVLLSSSSVQL